ncbi:MAG: zinc ABC transporter substrate-binding protein [Sneathiella sp.]
MKKLLLALCLLASPIVSAQAAETTGVLVSIAPLHSLVQGVMGKTGEADLLLSGYASPHDYQLKPSQVRAMQKANFVFYIGGGLETFLAKSFDTLPPHVRKISMSSKARLEILENREGGAWEAHDHSAHGHEGENEDDHKAEGHKEEAAHKEHDHHDHHDDEHAETDDHHFWLSPSNAKAMVKAIVQELARVYPENKSIYKENAKALIASISATDQKIAKDLESIKDVPYIVFHDAYQYFEKHYALTAVGSILLEPDEAPSVGRIQEIRGKLKETKAACIFQEPQFSDKLVKTVLEGTEARNGTLDPIGADIEPGPNHYIKTLENLAKNLKGCLSHTG